MFTIKTFIKKNKIGNFLKVIRYKILLPQLTFFAFRMLESII